MMWILHIVALVFFLPALFITIPMHIIIGKMSKEDNKKHEDFKLTT